MLGNEFRFGIATLPELTNHRPHKAPIIGRGFSVSPYIERRSILSYEPVDGSVWFEQV